MAMIKLMFSQPHPPFQEPSSSIPFHYNSPFSSGNSAPFHQIPYHQNQVTAERKEHPENPDSFYHMLQILLSPTYNHTWTTCQGNHHR